MIELGNSTASPFEVVDDVLDVPLDLRPLVADQLAGVVAETRGDVGDAGQFVGGQAEHVQRVVGVLRKPEGAAAGGPGGAAGTG